MCLGIPGRILELDETNEHLATADVMGQRRNVNIALLIEEGIGVGDWVIVHLGFAMERIDEEGAAAAREGLEIMGRPDPGASDADYGQDDPFGDVAEWRSA